MEAQERPVSDDRYNKHNDHYNVKDVLFLADKHITRYSSMRQRALDGHPGYRLDELEHLLHIWRGVKERVEAGAPLEELYPAWRSEIRDAIEDEWPYEDEEEDMGSEVAACPKCGERLDLGDIKIGKADATCPCGQKVSVDVAVVDGMAVFFVEAVE